MSKVYRSFLMNVRKQIWRQAPNRSGRLLYSGRYDQYQWRHWINTCRTANGWDINGLGQQKDGRGNICPVTIILPTLAMEAKGDVEEFMKILDQAIFDAKDMLLERFNYICSQSPESAKFMYENGLMAGYVPEEGIRSALKHGTLAVG